MSLTKVPAIFLAAFASLVLVGCLSGGGGGSDGVAGGATPAPTITTSDFFHLAVVPDQTVTTATFEVQVVAENINPAIPPAAPVVIDDSGISHAMAPKTLQWPGTAINSISIWAATIPLSSNKVNAIKVVSGTKQIAFSVRHKAALNIVTAANSAALIVAVKAAMTDPSIDIVEANYDDADFGATLHNVGNGIVSTRTTWLTVRPALGRTLTIITDFGVPALVRPMVDYLNLDGVIYGSDTSDGGGATLYTEANRHVWLSNVQFRGKYKFTWPPATPLTANFLAGVRDVGTEGQKTYFTECLWDGTASTVATAYAVLARDLQFNSHRGDLNNFGKVVLNVAAQDMQTVRDFPLGLDILHNDTFQIFGNVQTSDLVFKGLRITSPNIAADIQPFFFDSTFTPNYSRTLVDSITIVGGANLLKAQFAGVTSNSRISNISIPTQSVTFRQDFSPVALPSGAFAPANVYIQNFFVKAVDYLPASGGGTTFSIANANIANPADISPELRATGTMNGAVFSNIGLAP
jgi:hypothetical protein